MINYLLGSKFREDATKSAWFTRHRLRAKIFNSFIPIRILRFVFKKYYEKLDLIDVSSWKSGDIGKNRNPSHFRYADKQGLVQMEDICNRTTKLDKILDLGCNCGRFSNFLFENGYELLYGVDVMPSSFAYMEEWFPKMHVNLKETFSINRFQDYLPKIPDLFFDLTFTRGATVELISPNFPITKEVCRVSRKYVSFLISEDGHAYPRFWQLEFARQGFYLTKLLRPVSSNTTDTLMIFERA